MVLCGAHIEDNLASRSMVYWVKEYEVWTQVQSPHFINYWSGDVIAFFVVDKYFTLNVIKYMHVI